MEAAARFILGGALFLALCLGIKMLCRREATQEVVRPKEGWTRMRGWLYLVIWPEVTWFVVDPASRMNILVFSCPEWVRMSGLFVVMLGFGVRIGAQWAMGEQWSEKIELRPDHSLVRRGVYRFVRHPIYLSYVPISVGMFVVTGDWLLGIAAMAFAGMSLLRAVHEDILLARLAGYQEYAAKTAAGISKRVTIAQLQTLLEECLQKATSEKTFFGRVRTETEAEIARIKSELSRLRGV